VAPLDVVIVLLLLLLGLIAFVVFGYHLLTPRLSLGPTPDQRRLARDDVPPQTAEALAADLECQLAVATVEAARWKRSAASAEAHAKDLEQRLAAVSAEAANWKRWSVIAGGRAKELEQRLTSSLADVAAWEQRAASAKARVNELAKHQFAQSLPDDRFQRLHALLARELHPDHSKTEGIERIIRTELFKTLWPQIERI
jgi:hypothetical protein